MDKCCIIYTVTDVLNARIVAILSYGIPKTMEISRSNAMLKVILVQPLIRGYHIK